MRLCKVYLKNYIGLYNGMGIHEITIDFTKAIHNICIIRGDNGAGKSTLFNALNPINEAAKDFIPGLEAEKHISYFLDDVHHNILDIIYKSGVDDKGNRKSTTCHVYKRSLLSNTSVDLNPNGNVNDGKEIIFRELDIDGNFILLGQLSSGNRGLADKNPSERKKFINSKISELDVFNAIFKKLTKRSTELKSMVGSLSAKIDSIGNVEQMKNSIISLENTLGQLEDRKVLLVANIATDKQKLSELDENGDIITNYNSLKNELKDIDLTLEMNREVLETVIETGYINKLNLDLSRLRSKQEHLMDKSSTITSRRTDVSKEIETKQITLRNIGDIELFNSIQERVTELEKDLHGYIDIFKSIGFENYNSVSESEYELAINYIDRLNNMIDALRQDFSVDIIEWAFYHLYDYTQICTQDKLDLLEKNLSEANALLISQDTLRSSCKDFDSIPKDCNHKSDCPFISSIISAKAGLLSDKDYERLQNNIADINSDIEKFKKDSYEESEMIRCINQVKQILNNIPYSTLSKFPNTNWLESKEKICGMICMGRSIDLDVREYLKYTNLITLIKSHRDDVKNLKEQLSSIGENKAMIEMLTKDINKLSKDYISLGDQLLSISLELSRDSVVIEELESSIDRIKQIQEEKERLKSVLDRRDELDKLIPKLADDYAIAQRLNESISKNMLELEDLTLNAISKVQDEINEYKYKIVLYNDYTKEYNKYKEDYNKIEKIRYYCSPTTGIQTIFMEMYMNGIISVSNDLLQMFFGGEYVLHPFVINEKEFKMPCLGKGIMNDDISSMSTSQICMISMIISFALLRQTSESFGIVKIDEIDGGLDTQNRLKFVVALNKLMEILRYQQCIMISHNTELGMYDADIIVLKNTDPNLKIDGNVIFDINRGIA